MKETSAHILEFDAVREMMAGMAECALGKARIAVLQPVSERVWIGRQLRLTEEAREFLRCGARFDLRGLEEPGPSLEKAALSGATLETDEIRGLLHLADRTVAWKAVAAEPPGEMAAGWPETQAQAAGLADFRPLLKFFHGKIRPDGSLDDHASPELARLRKEIERQKRAIQESLRGFLRKLAEEGGAQEDLITIRGERFVIPVKAELKRKVAGVVHGTSSSGQTVYVEPLETLEKNNELVRLMEDEAAEVQRILREMTARLGAEAEPLRHAAAVLGETDLQFAKARFALEYGCCIPEFSDGALELRQARHPVLERNLRRKGGRAVPMSATLEGETRQLILSGPNTGGKTVALKTVGLLALMAQAGVPLPAQSACMPVFDAVLADIGDAQSIEQNLSTFSAHVTKIDRMTREATRDSLALLDELGSATDPEEGAALAVALAEMFRRIGCVTVISTHHTALKVYAANTPGVLNASVGFDEATLQPTYELRVGVPGISAGLHIAQRLGMNAEVIESARGRVGTQTLEVARFLERLQAEVAQVERERAALRQTQAEVERERARLAREGKEEQRKLTRAMESKLGDLLRDMEYQMRESVQQVQDRAAAKKVARTAEQTIARMRRETKERFDATVVAHQTGADRGDPNARPERVRLVGVGDIVRLKSMGREARVERKVDEETFEVSAGAMKMRVPRSDVAAVVHSAGGERTDPLVAARARGIQVVLSGGGADDVPAELHVIGKTVDEATEAVEKYLDRAYLAGRSEVRIVHGTGKGILQKALRKYLKSHPHVEAVSEPPLQQGGAGATVVSLRS